MKVLFAVSNEEISESIVKKYQKEYKQIISYKNVYYFNAILKELQKDKTYDRVVISEDLEAFTNTQYDQIDKFIFDKLDGISDEASNTRGNDIPIILICSDRREKSEEMLVKLFGIGVYNAIIGSDRSIDEVCRIINRPRSKKEAKSYYKINSENVSYQSENENDVSEMEIQNILAHYKRLGKNEERYIESFNNIAAQYNDTQLRIISKFLPLNVRAVLEEKSSKYQQIMSFNNSVSDTLRKSKKEEPDGPSEKLLVSKTRDKVMSRPVVIPSSVDMNTTKKLARVKPQQINGNINMDVINPKPQNRKNIVQQNPYQQEVENETVDEVIIEPIKRKRGRPRKNPLPEENITSAQPKRKRGRPRKNPLPEEVQQQEPEVSLPEVEEEFDVLPGFEENILPGFEEQTDSATTMLNQSYRYEDEDESVVLPGFDVKQESEEVVQSSNYPNTDFEEDEVEDNNYNTYSSNQNYQNYEQSNYNDYNKQSYGNQKNNNQAYNVGQDYNGYQDANTNLYSNNRVSQIKQNIDLSNLLTADKKIVTFVGTSKNGTSFIVNNVAEVLSLAGINTAILDTTKNRNSYYIYTKNEEELRGIATRSIYGLSQGTASGIQVNRNLTVYTSLPEEGEAINDVGNVLETLLKNHSLVLIDTDFNTPIEYFEQSQETYLVQSFDILTIQPLTAFLRELKAKNVLDEKKLRIILNKSVKIRGVSEKTIIGGMAYYNDPAMSFMTELFDRNLIKYVSIPFDEETYIKYLENIIECNITLKGYSKIFMQTLKELSNMIYPVNSTYRPPSAGGYGNRNTFSPNINNTLNQMKNNY